MPDSASNSSDQELMLIELEPENTISVLDLDVRSGVVYPTGKSSFGDSARISGVATLDELFACAQDLIELALEIDLRCSQFMLMHGRMPGADCSH